MANERDSNHLGTLTQLPNPGEYAVGTRVWVETRDGEMKITRTTFYELRQDKPDKPKYWHDRDCREFAPDERRVSMKELEQIASWVTMHGTVESLEDAQDRYGRSH